MSSPSPLVLYQWARQCAAGKRVGIPLAVISAGAFAYLAWALPGSSTAAAPSPSLYAVAAAFIFAILPYTGVFMMPTNRRLGNAMRASIAADVAGEKGSPAVGAVSEEQAYWLLRKWQVRNHGRALLPVVALTLGMWNTFA